MSLNNDERIIKIKKYLDKNLVFPYIVIAIPIFIVTFMLTSQIMTVSSSQEIVAGKREEELQDDLITLQRMYDELQEKYEENEKVVDEYISNTTTNSSLIESMQKQIDTLAVYAGSENLVGEGIIVTLDDGDKALEPELRTDAVVHDSDILTVVNELQAAGAEAISVNGQRITSMTSIRCVGPVIQINYQKIAPPYVINVIGNAQYLESAVNIKNGVADILTEIGVVVKVSRNVDVKVPKYSGSMNFKYSSIVK